MAAQLKPGQGPLDYGSRTWLKVLFATIFFILYAPIITLVAFSFNTDKRGIVWRGFTFDNYVKAWNNASLIEALTNSLVIALIATIFATVLASFVAGAPSAGLGEAGYSCTPGAPAGAGAPVGPQLVTACQ